MKRRHFMGRLGTLYAGLALAPNRTGRAVKIPPDPDFSAGAERIQSQAEDDSLWALVREQFCFPKGYSYFNTGGIGAVPAVVLNRVADHLNRSQVNPGPGHDHALWESLKAKGARLFGCSDTVEMALTGTATEGINIVVNGLPLKKGDEVITSTHEHPALNIPLLNRMQRDGIRIRTFEPDLKHGMGNIERIRRLINSRTRLIFVSHITCTTGQRFPETAVCDLAREHGIWTALDGAQAVGALPIDVSAYGVDFYAVSGHKWLLGPKRTGILYVRKALLETLRPITTGAYSDSTHDMAARSLTLQPGAQRYEYATQNDSLFCGLDRAIDFMQAIGLDRAWKHNRALAERFYAGLQGIGRVEILSPEEPEYRTSMITFKIKHIPFGDVASALSRQQFRVRVVPEAGLDAVRVSMHVYNHAESVDALVNAIAGIAA